MGDLGKPIAFFDVDKTLCAGYSGYFTTRELIRRGIIKKRRLLKAVLYKAIGHLFRHMNVRRMYEIALADMAGTHYDEIMSLGREIFEQQVKPRLYVQALEEIQKKKAEGHFIALISSGPYMCIKNMENFLGADTSFSIGPIIENGILLKTIREPLCYKEGKVTLARELAKNLDTSLEQCSFYSDSYSDLPLLNRVGHPHAVNPDRNLLQEAQSRGWPILRFEKRLGMD